MAGKTRNPQSARTKTQMKMGKVLERREAGNKQKSLPQPKSKLDARQKQGLVSGPGLEKGLGMSNYAPRNPNMTEKGHNFSQGNDHKVPK